MSETSAFKTKIDNVLINSWYSKSTTLKTIINHDKTFLQC